MAGAISIYLNENILRRLDAKVARLEKEDRAKGLTGRNVTNRSRLIERAIEAYLANENRLSIEEITYALVPLCEEFGIAKASLFGSYARGEADSASDVDILIEKGKAKGVEVLDFQDLLSERLGKPVDVVTTAGASDRFLSKIRRDEVLLYDAMR